MKSTAFTGITFWLIKDLGIQSRRPEIKSIPMTSRNIPMARAENLAKKFFSNALKDIATGTKSAIGQKPTCRMEMNGRRETQNTSPKEVMSRDSFLKKNHHARKKSAKKIMAMNICV